jgi:hypothetical protein
MGVYDFQPKRISEQRAETNYIANPLPVPTRRAHVEMDYDHVIPQDKMHFDIENPAQNFYDID